MMELSKKLEEAGLSNKETEVYISLLKNKLITGGKLAKILNMDRTHTYNILRNLINKGLASNIIKDNKTMFQSTSPKNLLNQIQKKEQIIQSIIPELESFKKFNAEDSRAQLLEGKEGLKTVLRMLLEDKSKEIFVYGATGKSFDVLKYEMPHAAKKTDLLRMKGKIITSEKLRGHLFTKLPNFQIKYIEEDTPSSTMIFGNKVSINVFSENPFALLIEDKSIADSYKKYFEYLWKTATK